MGNGLRVVSKQPINPDFMKYMFGEGEELDLNVASTESSGEEDKQSDKKVDLRRLSKKAFRSNSENMKQKNSSFQENPPKQSIPRDILNLFLCGADKVNFLFFLFFFKQLPRALCGAEASHFSKTI